MYTAWDGCLLTTLMGRQATTMPSIFVSNAGTGRCVPDVVGLGFTVAVQNGTAAGLIGGTSLAAPQTAAVWALRGHQENLHNRDLMYWLYAGRGGNLPKTDAYSGSIGTGFDQGWQSSGGYTPYDLVYGLGRAHDRDLMTPVNVAGMATPNATHSPSVAGLTTHANDGEEVTYEEDGWSTYDEAIEAEATSTVAAAPTAAEHRNTTQPNTTAARWHNGTGTHKSNASGSYVYTYAYDGPSYAEGAFGGGVVIVDDEPTAYGNGSGWGWGRLYTQFAIICLIVLLCCCARREISRRLCPMHIYAVHTPRTRHACIMHVSCMYHVCIMEKPRMCRSHTGGGLQHCAASARHPTPQMNAISTATTATVRTPRSKGPPWPTDTTLLRRTPRSTKVPPPLRSTGSPTRSTGSDV